MSTAIEVVPDHIRTKKVLAKTIAEMSDALNVIQLSGLNERAIIVLLEDATKVSKRTIKKVLDGIHQLRADYTNVE